MKTAHFEVRPAEAGLSLVEYLARRLSVSKNKAKEQLDRRLVFVNGRRVWMARHPLRHGDTVEVPSSPEAAPRLTDAAILHQDDHLVIANKPAGLLSNGPDSLESRLRERLKFPALLAVHRLDKDTSGCLLLAKSQGLFDRCVALFEARRIRKTYHAIVRGSFREREKTLTAPIDGQPAVTHMRTLDVGHQASHLLLTIDTGRTHQIRKHLAAIGHPVLGDTVYAGRRALSEAERHLARQMLHAGQLAFPHPITNSTLIVKAPLPADFLSCLRRFGLE
ncbi:MAG: RluA family pseudouridine synthase [Lentisphaerae bacterium]|nr:RluA family pseudouridine synthase [Lentisphaerota bacterium]